CNLMIEKGVTVGTSVSVGADLGLDLGGIAKVAGASAGLSFGVSVTYTRENTDTQGGSKECPEGPWTCALLLTPAAYHVVGTRTSYSGQACEGEAKSNLDIELQYIDWPADACVAAIRQLAKMPIAHLGLTVKGGYFAEAFRGHSCFVRRIAVFKNLKSFDLRLAANYVPYRIKKEIEEEMRCKLIKGYARKADIDKVGKAANLKCRASSETDNKAYKPKKKAKKSCQTVRSLEKHSDAATDPS
ncbi:MAG: hypothetical protein Q9164_007163, partial [Protoblastenia rupestris]